MTDALKRLSEEGVAIWLDDLSRKRITSGNLAELIDQQHVVGVTTNPSIFQKAISGGDGYDQQLADLAARKVTVEEAIRMITTADVRDAADILRPVFDATGGQDGRVSIEVDPRLAHNTQRDGRRGQAAGLAGGPSQHPHQDPGHQGGPPGDHRDHRPRHQRQRHADLLAGALPRGHGRLPVRPGEGQGARAWTSPRSTPWRPSSCPAWTPRSTSGSTRSAPTRPRPPAARPAVANARLAYEAYEEVFSGERWSTLERAGANKQRPLWASTGVKDPAYKDTLYVDDLVAPNTVNTMPEATLFATEDHGQITGNAVAGTYEQARAELDAVEKLGISYDDVVQLLEDEGVEKFEASWNDLLKSTEAELQRLAPSEG